jgi:hypothetical protein
MHRNFFNLAVSKIPLEAGLLVEPRPGEFASDAESVVVLHDAQRRLPLLRRGQYSYLVLVAGSSVESLRPDAVA